MNIAEHELDFVTSNRRIPLVNLENIGLRPEPVVPDGVWIEIQGNSSTNEAVVCTDVWFTFNLLLLISKLNLKFYENIFNVSRLGLNVLQFRIIWLFNFSIQIEKHRSMHFCFKSN